MAPYPVSGPSQFIDSEFSKESTCNVARLDGSVTISQGDWRLRIGEQPEMLSGV